MWVILYAAMLYLFLLSCLGYQLIIYHTISTFQPEDYTVRYCMSLGNKYASDAIHTDHDIISYSCYHFASNHTFFIFWYIIAVIFMKFILLICLLSFKCKPTYLTIETKVVEKLICSSNFRTVSVIVAFCNKSSITHFHFDTEQTHNRIMMSFNRRKLNMLQTACILDNLTHGSCTGAFG